MRAPVRRCGVPPGPRQWVARVQDAHAAGAQSDGPIAHARRPGHVLHDPGDTPVLRRLGCRRSIPRAGAGDGVLERDEGAAWAGRPMSRHDWRHAPRTFSDDGTASSITGELALLRSHLRELDAERGPMEQTLQRMLSVRRRLLALIAQGEARLSAGASSDGG